MSSPNATPSPPSPDNGATSVSQQPNGSSKDASASLKRVREGSQEPAAAVSEPTATKKNRVTSTSSLKTGANQLETQEEDDEDAGAEVDDDKGEDVSSDLKEGQNVGEVREKVEKMSYAEGTSGKTEGTSAENNAEAPGDQRQETEATDGESLKRKSLERSESSFAKTDDAGSKRLKDASPPVQPEEPKAEAPPVKRTQASFSSFASSSSPYAGLATPSPAPVRATEPSAAPVPAKKPQATFGAFSAKSSPFASTGDASSSTVDALSPTTRSAIPAVDEASTKKPQASFGAFSSSSSPFSSVKPATTFASAPFGSAPVKGSAFGSYSTASSPFAGKPASSSQPEEGSKSEAGPSSFGDILKDAGQDDSTESRVEMHEQEVTTGEEDEETVSQTRSKLYVSENGAWKERGVGLLKLNVRRKDRGGARLVMRADGVLRLMLNAKLHSSMKPQVDGKMVRMYVQNVDAWMVICLRMSNNKLAVEFAEQILSHVPEGGAEPSKGEEV
ncbi:hypothetical protein IAU60_001841 [Kwoniella sp. DSM 27419]